MTVIKGVIEGDTFKLQVPVLEPDGITAKDMTTATIKACATKAGVTVQATSASFTDAAAGIATVLFSAGALTAGRWYVEVEITLSSIVQTFTADTIVGVSYGPA